MSPIKVYRSQAWIHRGNKMVRQSKIKKVINGLNNQIDMGNK